VARHLLARILYPNPVCILLSANGGPSTAAAAAVAGGGGSTGGGGWNAMVISWLSCMDNAGHFVMAVNRGRHTAANLLARPTFTLSTAVAGMEPILLRIAGVTPAAAGSKRRHSGAGGAAAAAAAAAAAEPTDTSDKVTRVGVPLCRFGWGGAWPAPGSDDYNDGGARSGAAVGDACWPAVPQSPAHALCQMLTVLVDPTSTTPSAATATGVGVQPSALGHYLFLCRITAAAVVDGYWDTGKSYTLPPTAPPLLSFLGTGHFAAMTPLPPPS